MLGRFFRNARSPSTDTEIETTPGVDPLERVYAIGDIHGCHDLLAAIYKAIAGDSARRSADRVRKLVFLGDYVDRGDNSREVLRQLIDIRNAEEPNAIFLMGNHEAALLDFLSDPFRNRNWIEMGGRQTLFSFSVQPPRSPEDRGEHERAAEELHGAIRPFLSFLKSLPRSYRSGQTYFTHAGINPDKPLDKQSGEALLWGHPDFLDAELPAGIRVVHGHYANPEPVALPQRICVDTGAYYSGRLTAIRMDDENSFLTVRRKAV